MEREIQRSNKELWLLTGCNLMSNLAIHCVYRSCGITLSARTEELFVCFPWTFGTRCSGLWYHLQRQVISSICIITHLQRDKTHTTTISTLFGHLIAHLTTMENEACEISTSNGDLCFSEHSDSYLTVFKLLKVGNDANITGPPCSIWWDSRTAVRYRKAAQSGSHCLFLFPSYGEFLYVCFLLKENGVKHIVSSNVGVFHLPNYFYHLPKMLDQEEIK